MLVHVSSGYVKLYQVRSGQFKLVYDRSGLFRERNVKKTFVNLC
jgi:hypothetical protein